MYCLVLRQATEIATLILLSNIHNWLPLALATGGIVMLNVVYNLYFLALIISFTIHTLINRNEQW